MSEPAPQNELPVLTDTSERPLRDLRISVTDRCNFRCPYCMPAEIFGDRYEFLPKQEILTFEEIERLARIFVGLGVESCASPAASRCCARSSRSSSGGSRRCRAPTTSR